MVRDETSVASDDTSNDMVGMSENEAVERRDSAVIIEIEQDEESTKDIDGQRIDRELASEP